MQMKKNKFTITLGYLALLAGFVGAGQAANAQTYAVTDLGVLPDKKMSSPAAINNQEQVAGTSFAAADNQSAFVYSNPKGAMDELGQSMTGSVNRAFGINNAGVVVGDSTFGGAAFGPSPYSHAALYSNGSGYDLGSLKIGEYSRANGINLAGVVVGFSGAKLDGTSSRAFAWSAKTGMIDIGTLGGAYAAAFSINDAGFITGNSETANSKIGRGTHAFLYHSGAFSAFNAMRDLGTLGGDSSYGTFINANNHVVGYSTNNDGRVHAFLHAGVKMEDLGSLGGKAPQSDQSFALGVNAADQVVGYTYLPLDQAGALKQPQPVAFFCQNGAMLDLNELIGTAAKSYRLTSATAINDKGQIIANALEYGSGTYHAVLLTPVKTDPPQRSVRNARR